jgi:hypothetical protein
MLIVVSQPRYLPSVNYLQRLYFSDVFVLLDNVQRQSRGFENRNKLLTPDLKWLSIPIESSNREVIFNTKISEKNEWIGNHKKIIRQFYSKHPYFDQELLDEWYKDLEFSNNFTSVMEKFLKNVCQTLGFEPNMIRSTSLLESAMAKGVDNIYNIVECVKGSGKIYISGVNGRNYGINEVFKNSQTQVFYHDWVPLEYQQKGQSEFYPFMPFLDYAFNMGMINLKEIVMERQVFNDE